MPPGGDQVAELAGEGPPRVVVVAVVVVVVVVPPVVVPGSVGVEVGGQKCPEFILLQRRVRDFR